MSTGSLIHGHVVLISCFCQRITAFVQDEISDRFSWLLGAVSQWSRLTGPHGRSGTHCLRKQLWQNIAFGFAAHERRNAVPKQVQQFHHRYILSAAGRVDFGYPIASLIV